MADPGVELVDSRTLTRDRRGAVWATRTFRVPAANDMAALSSPVLPAMNSPYPTEPKARLERYEARPVGSGGVLYDVTAYYSSDGRWTTVQRPPDPAAAPGTRLWTVSFVVEEQVIPYMRRAIVEFPGANAPERKALWIDAQELRIRETRVVFSVTLALPGFSVGMIESIASQNDRLHRIDGTHYYQFICGDARQRDDETWEITYTWRRDMGTDWTVSLGSSDEIRLPPAISDPIWGAGAYVRLPYHDVVMIADPDDPALWPTFRQVQKYQRWDDGHRSLPGGPLP